ncbi:MAG TPA: glycerol-3-phosphate 1-O-acyltransferase PlsY [Longimicrobiales bacterium]|nr:glycerol-3-phosphate 1-O-acyltransferase PlsY [Longimicrobiales bacterium]
MTQALLAVASYLIGAIPHSYLAGRVRGIDLREHGSGNLGATNAFRVLGARWAAPVMVLDVAKGFVPTYFFPALAGGGTPLALVFGVAAILGHVFPVYMRFRGGKGVATGSGVFLALAPAAVAIGLVIWGVLVGLTGIVSVGSIAAALALPVLVWWLYGSGIVLAVAIALAGFVLVTHRANIRRLLSGEEASFRNRERAS